jgi:YD repeat-containing protein
MHMAVPTSQSAFNAGNNRLTAGGYDAAGNMTSHPWITPGGSMAYNANNLMTSFTATGVSVQTTYDAEGRRVRKIKGTETTLWVYDASGRLEIGDSSGIHRLTA